MFFKTSTRLSEKSIEDFKKDFGEEIYLKGASYDGNGNVDVFEYECDHILLVKFRENVRNFLKQHNFPYTYFTVLDTISLSCHEELSDSQINDFGKTFEVQCMKYSISCNSNDIKYEFNDLRNF